MKNLFGALVLVIIIKLNIDVILCSAETNKSRESKDGGNYTWNEGGNKKMSEYSEKSSQVEKDAIQSGRQPTWSDSTGKFLSQTFTKLSGGISNAVPYILGMFGNSNKTQDDKHRAVPGVLLVPSSALFVANGQPNFSHQGGAETDKTKVNGNKGSANTDSIEKVSNFKANSNKEEQTNKSLGGACEEHLFFESEVADREYRGIPSGKDCYIACGLSDTRGLLYMSYGGRLKSPHFQVCKCFYFKPKSDPKILDDPTSGSSPIAYSRGYAMDAIKVNLASSHEDTLIECRLSCSTLLKEKLSHRAGLYSYNSKNKECNCYPEMPSDIVVHVDLNSYVGLFPGYCNLLDSDFK